MELVRIPTQELDKVWSLIEKDIRKALLYSGQLTDSDFVLEMAKQNKSIIQSIENMKLTWAWHYVHLDGKNKEQFKKYVLQQLNVK